MKMEVLLAGLFPDGHAVEVMEDVVTGFAATPGGEVAVMGTDNHLAIGAEAALRLAEFVLAVVRDKPGCPLLMLVDTQGQRMSRQEEMLGINGYLAHLIKCLELARKRGSRLLSLVYSEGVSGGFLAFGLMADEIHALPEARVHVMNLPAMARITKLPLEVLQSLSETSPIFAPGVENFFKLGGVQSIWAEASNEQLSKALGRQGRGDRRREDGLARGGRERALPVSRSVADG